VKIGKNVITVNLGNRHIEYLDEKYRSIEGFSRSNFIRQLLDQAIDAVENGEQANENNISK